MAKLINTNAVKIYPFQIALADMFTRTQAFAQVLKERITAAKGGNKCP